jgi:flagellar FliL protein
MVVADALVFVPLDPLVISLPGNGGRVHLRFTAQLEVAPEYALEVEAVKPRIVDVLNSYLRAVRVAELEDPAILIKLRGQMLRRVQIVTGEGRVRDLLIMEFVLN